MVRFFEGDDNAIRRPMDPLEGKGAAMTETREMYEIPSEQLTQHDLDELRRLTMFAGGAFPDNMRPPAPASG